MTRFKKLYAKDKRYKDELLREAFDPVYYGQAVGCALDDVLGVMAAYKAGVITTEDEMHEQLKIFLGEFAVSLVNGIKAPTAQG